MKKLLHKLLLTATALIAGVVLFSCANAIDELGGKNSVANGNGSRALNPTVDVTIYLLGAPSNCTKPGVWAWAKADKDTNYSTVGWPGDLEMTKTTAGGFDAYTYMLKVDPTYNLGILFVNISGASPQTGDIIIPKEKISSAVTYYFNWNSMAYYSKVEDCIGLFGVQITAVTSSSATLTGATSLISKFGENELSIKDSDGKALKIDSAEITKDVATIVVSNGEGDIKKYPYTVTYKTKEIVAALSTALIESTYGEKASKVNDLGLTLSGTTATFKTWAPTATKATVLLYDTAAHAYKQDLTKDFEQPGSTTKDWSDSSYTPTKQDMTFDSETGIWTASNVSVNDKKYYKYELEIDGKTYYVADIWHTVAAADSAASQIATIDDTNATPANWEANYTNPFGSTVTETKTYNDAVIYEMHIRDWSRAVVTDSTGKFLDIANSTNIINHLKDLGVTHVQILPMFDYAQINSNKDYNWGYNPYHYNVPEGRYVTEGYEDGTKAVKEMREMIKAFHDNGIAVIMDVVYNHTSSTGEGSLYDSTVPGYFYRQDASGNYINGSGCGNEVATNHVMVKKYVIDSLKHWMKDYHINGFRFDLMGCLKADTMKEIYDELYAIDKNVLVYGEPWTGGTSGVVNGAVAAGKGTSGYGYGAFDDDYRDAIKGGEFGGFQLGEVQGTFTSEANLLLGLKGETITKNSRNATGITGLALHYAECHDNYTLFDKLVYSTIAPLSGDFANKFAPAYGDVMKDEAKLKTIKDEVKLAGAYVILSQGTPFLNGGQEFLRTKKGDPDSYAADKKGGVTWTSRYAEKGSYVPATDIDDVNTIDLTMKETYSDVYNTYKGLIALRKSSTAFTDPTSATAEKIVSGVTKYTVSNGTDTFEVIFNATDSAYSGFSVNGTLFGAGVQDAKTSFVVTSGKQVTISEEDGSVSVEENDSEVSSIPAKSFVIVKK